MILRNDASLVTLETDFFEEGQNKKNAEISLPQLLDDPLFRVRQLSIAPSNHSAIFAVVLNHSTIMSL